MAYSENRMKNLPLTNVNLILGFFGWYGLMMSVPLFIIGTFTGLHLFLGAFIHLVVALVSFSCREGLQKKLSLAWWCSLGVGVSVGCACIGMFWNMLQEKVFILVLFFPTIFFLLSVCLVVGLIRFKSSFNSDVNENP